MFLGLRMNKGGSKHRFFEKFDKTVEQVYEQAQRFNSKRTYR